MSTGADPKSMPNTPEFEEGYRRIYGDKVPERGSWVWCPVREKLIPKAEYVPVNEARALDAPIMVDRFYEGARIPVFENGAVKVVDVGSRQRHREFLRQRGLTTTDDFDKPGGEWERAEKEREARQRGEFPDRKERREELGRIAYEVEKKHAR